MKSPVETLALDVTNGLERLDRQKAERRWREIHRHFKEEGCPITRFLIERGWQDSEAMAWHHQLYEGAFDPDVVQQLLQWIAQ